MSVGEILDELLRKAGKDEKLREELLATEHAKEPVDDFCRICRREGYELYAMDLLTAGEEAYAAMKRSTNGGGENSPMLNGEDDYYEMFLAELKSL